MRWLRRLCGRISVSFFFLSFCCLLSIPIMAGSFLLTIITNSRCLRYSGPRRRVCGRRRRGSACRRAHRGKVPARVHGCYGCAAASTTQSACTSASTETGYEEGGDSQGSQAWWESECSGGDAGYLVVAAGGQEEALRGGIRMFYFGGLVLHVSMEVSDSECICICISVSRLYKYHHTDMRGCSGRQ